MDDQVFDVAASLPQSGGQHVGGQVFASVDLQFVRLSDLEFGIFDGKGLCAEALIPYESTHSGYAEAQHREKDVGPDIWQRIAHLAPQVGINCFEKYGTVRREYRGKIE